MFSRAFVLAYYGYRQTNLRICTFYFIMNVLIYVYVGTGVIR